MLGERASDTEVEPDAPSSDVHAVLTWDASAQSDLGIRLAFNLPPGPPTVSETCASVASVLASGYTCGARISYLTGTGLSTSAAEQQVGREYPCECGACAPSDSALTCEQVLELNAGGPTCGARVEWLVANQALSVTAARAQASVTGGESGKAPRTMGRSSRCALWTLAIPMHTVPA